MKIFIKIEFCIDENMAWHAIEHLLNSKQRVSKKAVIELCRIHLQREGSLFEVEPEFDSSTVVQYVDSDVVCSYFDKIWK